MWPFKKRAQDEAAAGVPRWQQQLRMLRNTDKTDDARFLDGLRRCLVWYCNDELKIDPFVWLDLAEPSDDSAEAAQDDHSLAALRGLFFDLLHSPREQGVELRARLEELIAEAGRA